MTTLIPVTTLVAVVPASKQVEINKVQHNWVIGYILVYLIVANSDIYKNKEYRIVDISIKSFTYCVRFELLMEVNKQIIVFWNVTLCCLIEITNVLKESTASTMRVHSNY
jgi:hypothetical protein